MSANLTKATPLLPSLFDDMFKPWKDLFDINGGRSWTSTVPAVNITEEKDVIKLSMAAPGMTKEDFNIDVEDNIITISAEKEEKKESADEKVSRQEYNYSSFSRSFNIPENVVRENISAVYRDGVLKLTLPKKEAGKQENHSKKIEIK
ncbi:Hsp20/alpha crystallin family protein [Chitinophaga tropicalis]|uniref:Hsp20 family protein n=1 Tax=Chitinophaga tropicalis TaxID=2683588 RepID=A0A7K1U403_9BACT|nr:Hsp20/alpha crystallin family protein [Chitinophaga tropicalis]MVT08725.1 Hsp20 family protein [Chitinophaga tropicalis]